MGIARSILVLVCAAWLPLNCCSRLHVVAAAASGLLDGEPRCLKVCGGCCERPHADRDSVPRPAGRPCGCGGGACDQIAERAAGLRLESPMPCGAGHCGALNTAVLPGRRFTHVAPVRHAGEVADARIKASRTLLRLRCALTT